MRTKVALVIGAAGVLMIVAAGRGGGWARPDASGVRARASQTTAATLPPVTSCVATVSVVAAWPGNVQAAVTIRNTGTGPINNWYVQWTMPLDTTLAQGWNATLMKSGTTGMAHAAAWNAYLAPGASAAAGFLGSGSTTPTFANVTCG